jgi:hypothetical protein
LIGGSRGQTKIKHQSLIDVYRTNLLLAPLQDERRYGQISESSRRHVLAGIYTSAYNNNPLHTMLQESGIH